MAGVISRRELLIGSAAAIAFPAAAAGENWPPVEIKPEWVRELNERFAGTSGMFHDTTYKLYLQDYKSAGDYLNWGAVRVFQNDSEVVITETGLPMVKDSPSSEPYWNAVTLSHYALHRHGRGDRPNFFKAVDKLIDLQKPNGGFPYPARSYRDLLLPEGWISAMAQGNAMSAFYRATLISDDPRYKRAGELAFASLMTTTDKGGPATTLAHLDPSLSAYPFLAEYPTDPIDYTLNGYMFALLGLYDWSHHSKEAASAFARNIETLERLLPYHDIDGFSTYDLSHLVLKVYPYVHEFYEGTHVYLLHALASVTGSATLTRYEQRWTAKIDEMNRPLRITSISSNIASPQPVGAAITFRLTSAGGNGGKTLYQFAVRDELDWTTPQPFSDRDTFVWTPKKPGKYYIGFYAKEVASKAEYDNFRNWPFTINPAGN